MPNRNDAGKPPKRPAYALSGTIKPTDFEAIRSTYANCQRGLMALEAPAAPSGRSPFALRSLETGANFIAEAHADGVSRQ